MPPALTTTVRPARSGTGRPRRSTARQTAAISTGVGQPALAGVLAGEPADGGLEHEHARGSRSVATLARVAGCSHISVCIAGASTTGQRAVSSVFGQQVVGEAVGGLGQQVGGGGGDDDEVGRLADPHVRDGVDVVPGVGGGGLPGQGRPGGRADELQRARRRDDADVVAGLGQLPQQLDRLVGGDAARDAEDDAGARTRGPRTRRRVVGDLLVARAGRR